MQLPKKECIHISQILKETRGALKSRNAIQLKDLSNNTIHSTCAFQDEASITIAVLLYTLSKIVERHDFQKIKNWDLFVKKFNATLNLASKSIAESKMEEYNKYIKQARKTLESQSVNLKPYIQDVLKKAAINKGSRVHAHGISLEQTARLLGTTQWELSEYIGGQTIDTKHDHTINVKQRSKIAMEFFRGIKLKS